MKIRIRRRTRSIEAGGGVTITTSEGNTLVSTEEFVPEPVIIQQGTGITVAGSGASGDPYIISVDSNAIYDIALTAANDAIAGIPSVAVETCNPGGTIDVLTR